MTERELLELAAKAAGIDVDWKTGRLRSTYCFWNPLTDDGDALRLAVKLEIDLQHNHGSVIAIYTRNDSIKVGIPAHAEVGGDDYQDRLVATRRAIVRAAAAIGKDMK